MKIVFRWQPLALWGITVLGFALRLYGLNWDQGNSFHPDERQILFHVTTLAWPTSFAQFLDPVKSPLNPHFFAYGSFPLYLLAIIANILSHFWPALNSFANVTLIGRVLSALFDSGTVLLTGFLGWHIVQHETQKQRTAWNVALLASALVAFTPFQLQLSHFYAVDSLLLFFVLLTVYACVVLVDTEKPLRWSLLIGLGYGLALGTKFSAAPLGLPLLVAALMRWYRKDMFSALLSFFQALIATIIIFLLVQPYTLLDTRNVVQQILEQGDLARGLLDLPYVRQFAGTTPYVYEMQNMLFWGLGVMLGVAVIGGLLWLLWRVWRRNVGLWMVLLSWVVVYVAIVGSFYVKFMRYMLPIYPFLTLLAAAWLVALTQTGKNRQTDADEPLPPLHTNASVIPSMVGTTARPRPQNSHRRLLFPFLSYAAIGLVLAGTIFQGLALLNVYSQPNTRVQASEWMYAHIPAGSTITYEQWDDPLPVSVGANDPSMFTQLTYPDANGQPATGLDLYGDDTVQKAQLLAHLLPQLQVLTMASDRLDKSIPRLPFRYPLTIHYYQLLFSGQLGFHIAATFQNHPHLFGVTLDDSSADESYSVFDHPTVRLFVRDTPYPYTEQQLFQKLLAGVRLPAPGANLSGAQHSLLLTPQQIADDQQSPPFGVQFPATSLANALPVFFWWLTLTLLGILTYPLLFLAFRPLPDRGYIFSKLIGLLLLSYLAWILASTHVLPFSHGSLLLVFGLLACVGLLAAYMQRRALLDFVRQRWRLLLTLEALFSIAYLLFVSIRSLNPDLWNIYIGGEKPMELAFLNAVLRSPYMPPLDPWFAGGYINYYYYGYVIFGSLIKLTGIIPTTAFNLAIPTLFALTFSGAVVIVYSLTQHWLIALIGGYFTALIGNFNGLIQLKGQLFAFLAHVPVPMYDYWQSSRVIPFTINEFPFWSFLFADLHPHVIDMPIAVCMLGSIATLVLSGKNENDADALPYRTTGQRILYLFAAFIFGTIACVNPWDMPVYAILLALALLIQLLQGKRQKTLFELSIALAYRVGTLAAICGIGYLLYFPFYANYQQLYVNGLGRVTQGTSLSDFLTVFGFWLFLAGSFFCTELYTRWSLWREAKRMLSLRPSGGILSHLVGAGVGTMQGRPLLPSSQLPPLRKPRMFRAVTSGKAPMTASSASYGVLGMLVLLPSVLLGTKLVLLVLLLLGSTLLVVTVGQRFFAPRNAPATNTLPTVRSAPTPVATHYTTLLLVMALSICLGMELVYIRDFLDGGDYERMNTVFKFSMQAWLCFALGGAVAVYHLWQKLRGLLRRVWFVTFAVFMISCSIFLVQGTAARIHDHQAWIDNQPPSVSANYTPTLDGAAFVTAWYPGDARAIAWLNANVTGSPVLLEAAAPVSYQWFNRVSVFTGLPDVLGWPDHVGEQRYDYQPVNRLTDIGIIYSTTDTTQAIELLHYYHVRYVYVGELERQLYAQRSSAGLDKFQQMSDSLHVVYQAYGVTIYEVL